MACRFKRGVNKASSKQPFGFTGYRIDDIEITGTYFAQAREYGSEIGRFTAQDTHWHTGNMFYGDLDVYEDYEKVIGPDPSAIRQSNNLYEYTLNDPLNSVDLNGECKFIIRGARRVVRWASRNPDVALGLATEGANASMNLGGQVIEDGWDDVSWLEVTVSFVEGYLNGWFNAGVPHDVDGRRIMVLFNLITYGLAQAAILQDDPETLLIGLMFAIVGGYTGGLGSGRLLTAIRNAFRDASLQEFANYLANNRDAIFDWLVDRWDDITDWFESIFEGDCDYEHAY